jgi:hypothetical protein
LVRRQDILSHSSPATLPKGLRLKGRTHKL